MKRQIEVGQTFRRGGARGKLWKVDEILSGLKGARVFVVSMILQRRISLPFIQLPTMVTTLSIKSEYRGF